MTKTVRLLIITLVAAGAAAGAGVAASARSGVDRPALACLVIPAHQIDGATPAQVPSSDGPTLPGPPATEWCRRHALIPG
jgi:hypothetical protein